LAGLLGVPVDEIAGTTTANAERVFALPPEPSGGEVPQEGAETTEES
jgi:hypothetical protein